MSLIHQAGNTCAVGELDLHALLVTQKDILKTILITKTTNNALTNTTTNLDIPFEESNNYTDLSEATLFLKFTIENADGTALNAAVEAALVNNILHSIFSNVQLLINGEKVTGTMTSTPTKPTSQTSSPLNTATSSLEWKGKYQTQLDKWTLKLPPTWGGSKGGPTQWELSVNAS